MVAECGELAAGERRRRVAAILAVGVVRVRQAARCAGGREVSDSGAAGLEVVSKVRLSVSRGRANGSPARANEARNDRTF